MLEADAESERSESIPDLRLLGAAALAVGTLAACGGGGSAGTTTPSSPTPTPTPPVATPPTQAQASRLLM